ncbi:MAG: carbon-nitrogen hydrolase family protein [Hamadaea sp.]|uniref:carbon-nitrogen hydrolase family protein n=1 Tax=Hamadaea sp. TaxID=2024425 RepID=UPI0017FC43AC|nr:carbon-nitrogen hydrolase family protein [Hamadaea sp.]NUR73707.1 carbon-nitrogen hydrolase family protein [Hamadaea sp.]NUT22557.1 carbon-nitrogen hydrolase family protein [Hamadaea sp.]
MITPLIVAAAQPACSAYDVAANALSHADLVRAANARVVVFPEMSLTGYEFDAAPVELDDPRLAPIVAACAETGSIALVGAPVAGAAGVDGAAGAAGVAGKHIGVLAIDGDGVRVAYRKMFLGGAEPEHFVPGDAPALLDIDGWRLGLAVCKDTGVAEHAAATCALGVDAYVAGALDGSHEIAVQDERARRTATTYGVWVVTASFAGSTGGGYDDAAGRSRIWDPVGNVVAEAGPQVGAYARAGLVPSA